MDFGTSELSGYGGVRAESARSKRTGLSGGHAVELADAFVEGLGGGEATQSAQAAGEGARGVAEFGSGVSGCGDDDFGDDGRVVALLHGGFDDFVEDAAPFGVEGQGSVGLDGVRVEAGFGVGGFDEQDPDAVFSDFVVQGLRVALDGVF